MAIVIIDWDLRIRRFTPAAAKLLSLTSGDVGRPIADIPLNVDVPDLDQVCATALFSGIGFEREVQDRKGRWFSLRVRQYRTAGNRVDGATLMLRRRPVSSRKTEGTRAASLARM